MRLHSIFYILISGFFLITSAQAAQVNDIRVVIDVSGSMLKTDPNNLRVPALRMINGLIPAGSKAGVWTFGRYVNMEVKWGTVNKKWRKLADQGANKIHSKGQYTNIERALKRASQGWEKKDKGTSRNLILLTDGKVDVSKDASKDARSRENILNKTIPDLLEKGVKIHTIALSGNTDEVLLKRLALKTHGTFEIANTADDLQRIFLHMFERATKPDTVPLKDNAFTIDKSISEMTILVFRKNNKITRLIQPDKVVHSEQNHRKNVGWRFERGYDLITVTKPKPGKWLLDATVDDDNRVMIVTKLKLQVDEIPAYITPDEDINIHVELHSDNKKITKKSFLKFVDFNLQHKQAEKITKLPLKLKKSRDIKDKGIYLQTIKAPLKEGKHEILVQADARTFTRSKRVGVQVQWPVTVEVSKTNKPGVYNLSIQAREEYIKADTLMPEVTIIHPDKTEQKLEITTPGNVKDLEIVVNKQDGLHQLEIKIQAQTLEGKVETHQLVNIPVLGVKVEPVKSQQAEKTVDNAPEKMPESQQNDLKPAEIIEEPPQEQESDWVHTLIFVAIANVILIIIVAGSYLFIRKRMKKDQVQLVEEGADDGADDDEVLLDD